MQERRNFHRGRTFLSGRITFNNRFSTMDCLVRNLSQNGAKLIISSPVMIPHEFDIHIHRKGDSQRARLIWRSDTEMGIALVRAGDGAVVSIETARRIRMLEADRDALAKRVTELSVPA